MKQKIQLTESELYKIIKNIICEEFHYDNESEGTNNILISDTDMDEMTDFFNTLGFKRMPFDIKRLPFTYADGRLEADMRHDVFYIYLPMLPEDNGEPTSFYAYYKGKKCIIGQWNLKDGTRTGLAIYANDEPAKQKMIRVMKSGERF